MSLSEKFVGPISKIKYEQLPSEVIFKAKLCILHTFACTFAGLDSSWSKAARDMTAAFYPDGDTSVWFTSQRTNVAEAVFTNAVAVQSILYEDIHRDSNAHPGIIIPPVVLALGEHLHLDGKKIITALVAGYEMMGRIGRGTVSPDFASRGFRPTSIIGTFGSAISAGILLNLTYKEHLCAFALAANFTSGINEWAFAGSDDLYFQNGWAARGGVIAAALAARGVTAPTTILEGKNGFINAYSFSSENLKAVNCEDGNFVISDVLFKPAPACALVQTTGQAALDARKAGIKPKDIVKGEIITFELGKSYAGCDYAGPFSNVLQARMSNQFNFAAALVNGKITNQNYLNFADPKVNDLAGKLTVRVERAYTDAFPVKQPVRVDLIMCDNQLRSFYREEPVYLDAETIVSKLFDYCTPVYGRSLVEQALDRIFNLEKISDVSGLCRLFSVDAI
ncbi:MAG: MmgE/PrpD family protein [Desulfarculales bacterium]|jgi:2-methylcitrate dehydratase PrpD|nr:MmgE/PrpD family protein [Desulfarculales bacterium]